MFALNIWQSDSAESADSDQEAMAVKELSELKLLCLPTCLETNPGNTNWT